MFKQEIKKTLAWSVAIALVIAAITPLLLARTASAATLTNTAVRFDRMKASTATTGTVCATPTTAGTEASVQVTFPTGFTVSSTTGNWTVNTTNTAWPTGAAAWSGIGSATAVSGQTVTFPSSDLTVATLYCFNWTSASAVTTGSAGNSQTGTVVTQTSSPSTIDSGTYATAVLADDQIVVTASVATLFAFSLSANSDSLGALTTSSVSVSPTPRVANINTNANNGWYVWAKDATTGLYSANASYTISSTTPGTNSTLSAGTQGYNMGVTNTASSGAGTVSIATPFVGGSTGRGGGLNTSLQTIASSTGGNNTDLTLTNNAAISSTTEAASDYTDTITVVAAGLF